MNRRISSFFYKPWAPMAFSNDIFNADEEATLDAGAKADAQTKVARMTRARNIVG